MLAVLRKWLGSTSNPAEIVPLGAFSALATRVQELEDMQLKREVEWRETKDQIARHLKRVSAIEQRREQREGGEESGKPYGAAFAMKFNRKAD